MASGGRRERRRAAARPPAAAVPVTRLRAAPKSELTQGRAPGAHEPGDPEDLALAHLEGHVAAPRSRPGFERVLDRPALDLEQRARPARAGGRG